MDITQHLIFSLLALIFVVCLYKSITAEYHRDILEGMIEKEEREHLRRMLRKLKQND